MTAAPFSMEFPPAENKKDFESMPQLKSSEPQSSERSLADQLASRRKAMSIGELADVVGLSQASIYGAAKSGSLKALRFGGAIRIDPKDAAEWIRRHGG